MKINFSPNMKYLKVAYLSKSIILMMKKGGKNSLVVTNVSLALFNGKYGKLLTHDLNLFFN